jgi:uncharacterized membrane protein YedE/YeeE
MEQMWIMGLDGGVLIGISSVLMLALLGQIAGISGIFAGAIRALQPFSDSVWRWCFLIGLVAGAALFHGVSGRPFPEPSSAGLPLTIVAGLLVGFGTRLGGGCTSGHGVCGIGRLSVRSLLATAAFMAAGFVTVYLVRHVLSGAVL